MARPKKFSRRLLVRLTDEQIDQINALAREKEDRSDFLRQAAELEIAIRQIDVYGDLIGYLTANETMTEFCAKAVRQAALKRISALTESDGSGQPKLDHTK